MTTITSSVDRALNADPRFAIIKDSVRGTNKRLSDAQIALCLAYIRTDFSVRGLLRYFSKEHQLFLGAGDCLSISGVDKICKILEESSFSFCTDCKLNTARHMFRATQSQTLTTCDPKRFYQIVDAILILVARSSYPVSLSAFGPSYTPWDGTYAENSSRIELRVDQDCYLTTSPYDLSVFPKQLFSTMAAYSVAQVSFYCFQSISFKALRLNDIEMMRKKATENLDNEWVTKVVPKGCQLTWTMKGDPTFYKANKFPEKRIQDLDTDFFEEDSGVSGSESMCITLQKLPSSTKMIEGHS